MKKTLILFCAALMLGLPLTSAAQLVERSYVCTDRHAYVAGEDIFCSVFCFDGSRGELSGFSSIAYLELVSPEGSAVRAKVALRGGRGAGRLRIPSELPSGNYRLIAYTAQNRNEKDMDWIAASRVVSVYNTLSSLRQGSVTLDASSAGTANGTVGSANASTAPAVTNAPAASAPLEMERRADTLVLRSRAGQTLDFCLSLSIRDAVPDPESPSLRDCLDHCSSGHPAFRGFDGNTVPEYDGEIVSIRVPAIYSGVTALLSSPGRRIDIYSSTVDSTGLVSFFTGNVYGDKDLVFELNSREADENFQFEVLSPFVSPACPENAVPQLLLDESLRDDLTRRSVAMQIGRHFGIDEHCDSLPLRPDLLFSGAEMIEYDMDDYTRFPTMKETITEYVKELYVRREDGESVIRVVPGKDLKFSTSMLAGQALVLVDGVPVTEHSRALDINPALLKRICIYPYDVSTGSCISSGVVNFVSYRGDMAGCSFPGRVRMLGFKGASIPVSIGPGREDSLSPDYRYTRIWQPLLHLEPGEEAIIPLGTLPEGNLRLELEGLCIEKNGAKPLYISNDF